MSGIIYSIFAVQTIRLVISFFILRNIFLWIWFCTSVSPLKNSTLDLNAWSKFAMRKRQRNKQKLQQQCQLYTPNRDELSVWLYCTIHVAVQLSTSFPADLFRHWYCRYIMLRGPIRILKNIFKQWCGASTTTISIVFEENPATKSYW